MASISTLRRWQASLDGLGGIPARGRGAVAALILAAAVTGFSEPGFAMETDQYSNRDAALADSTDVLNAQVNRTIAVIVAGWDQGNDEMAMVDAIYHAIGGHFTIDKLERWAMRSDEVEKLDTPSHDSVFSGLPWYALRMTSILGVGKTIRVNGELIGSDKIGHFLSQGRKFYKRYLRTQSESEAARRSAYTERAIFGRITTGSYSNADLVANYEGHLFFRSLFEDGVIPGKPAILRWEGDHWRIQRQFDWADHVNAYWDEALNVNHFDRLLYEPMRKRLVSLCPQYWEKPELYAIEDEAALIEKYAHLQLVDTRDMRLNVLCPVQRALREEKSLPDAPAAP